MAWILLIIAALGVFAVLRFVAYLLEHSTGDYQPDVKAQHRSGRICKKVAWAVLIVWVLLDTVVAVTVQVPAGQVGVVYEFGAIKGQVSEGFNLIAPWRSATLADIRVQRHFFEKLDAFSKETQDVFVAATLNIRVSPQAIQQLYRTVGPRYFEILIAPRVAQNFKDETVKYNSVDIAPNREPIRQEVKVRLERELSPYSIEVDDLLLENIDFPKAFKDAIEQKQIATQNALEAEQRVEQSRFVAQQKVKEAEGEGQAILVVAQKQAEANGLLSASLTPALVQYALIQKLGDDIKVIMLPSNQQFILGEGMLK